jgi:hypothetical protein
VLVRDLGGKNRAALGESWLPTDRDVVWRRPAMLRVGRTVLAITEPVADALAELEAAADEALPEEGAPPPPPSSRVPSPPSHGLGPGNAAPLVEMPPPRPRPHAEQARGWSVTDVVVAGAAVLVIALSAAGLYWLLHG